MEAVVAHRIVDIEVFGQRVAASVGKAAGAGILGQGSGRHGSGKNVTVDVRGSLLALVKNDLGQKAQGKDWLNPRLHGKESFTARVTRGRVPGVNKKMAGAMRNATMLGPSLAELQLWTMARPR